MVNGNGFPYYDGRGSGAGWCSDSPFNIFDGKPTGAGNGSGKSYAAGDRGIGNGKGKLPRRIDYYEVDKV